MHNIRLLLNLHFCVICYFHTAHKLDLNSRNYMFSPFVVISSFSIDNYIYSKYNMYIIYPDYSKLHIIPFSPPTPVISLLPTLVFHFSSYTRSCLGWCSTYFSSCSLQHHRNRLNLTVLWCWSQLQWVNWTIPGR